METSFGIGDSTVTLRAGNITDSRAEVLVSSDDTSLSMGGGVSQALRSAAGEALLQEARKATPTRPG